MNFSYLSTHSLKLIFFFFEAFDLDFFLVAFDEAFFVSVVDLLSSILIPLVSLLDISSVLVSEVELFFMVEELLAIGVVVEVVSEGLFFGLFFNTNQMIISKNPQFTGISARQQLEFTTHLLLTD